MAKIKYTKKGQPYKIDSRTGKARFIKKTKTKKTKSYKANYKRGRTMARKKSRSYKRDTSILGKLKSPVVGALGGVAYESFISPLIPANGIAKDMIELLGGAYLSKKKGILGSTGKTLTAINAYQLTSGFVKPMLGGMIGMESKPENRYVYG